MVWAKLDDAILDNPKIARVGVLGFAMHVAAITWCSRNLSDGFIPEGRVGSLLDLRTLLERNDNPRPRGDDELPDGFEIHWWNVSEELVKSGLWHEVDGGYQLHDYLEFNPSREEVVRQRAEKSAAGKEGAKKRWGDRPAKADAKAPPKAPPMAGAIAPAMAPPMAERWQNDAPVPDPDPKEGDRARARAPSESGVIPKRVVTNATDDGVMGDSVAAWCDGVRAATGKPFALARGGPTVVVVEAILTHGPPAAERASWARLKAKAWAEQLKGRVLKPHDFGDWLNSDEPARAPLRIVEVDEPSNAERGAAERRAKESAARKEAPRG